MIEERKFAILFAATLLCAQRLTELAARPTRRSLPSSKTPLATLNLFVGRRSRFPVFGNRHWDESYNAANEELVSSLTVRWQ